MCLWKVFHVDFFVKQVWKNSNRINMLFFYLKKKNCVSRYVCDERSFTSLKFLWCFVLKRCLRCTSIMIWTFQSNNNYRFELKYVYKGSKWEKKSEAGTRMNIKVYSHLLLYTHTKRSNHNGELLLIIHLKNEYVGLFLLTFNMEEAIDIQYNLIQWEKSSCEVDGGKASKKEWDLLLRQKSKLPFSI